MCKYKYEHNAKGIIHQDVFDIYQVCAQKINFKS